jgi:hypothetical protein
VATHPPRLSDERSEETPCHTFPLSSRPEPGSARHLIALIGYGLIVFILWMPEFPQRILSPVALFVALAVVLAIASVLVAKQVGTLPALYKSDFKHVAG